MIALIIAMILVLARIQLPTLLMLVVIPILMILVS